MSTTPDSPSCPEWSPSHADALVTQETWVCTQMWVHLMSSCTWVGVLVHALALMGAFCFFCWFSLALDRNGRQRWWPSTHSILKWPLLACASLVVVGVLALYMATRTVIACLEWLFVSARTRRLRRSLEHAGSLETYRTAAAALDEANELNAWKAESASRFYASHILEEALRQLQEAQRQKDWPRVLHVLQRSLREVNFAGHLTEALYAKSFCGSKQLIDRYCEAVVSAIAECHEELLAAGDMADSAGKPKGYVMFEEARRFVEFSVCTFGRSALCLSGGGAMAFQHFGVVQELFNLDLLPKIISGTSGGAAVASYVCCRTDAELRGEVKRGKYPLKLDPDEIQPGVLLWGGTWLERTKNYCRRGCLFEREPIERFAKEWSLGDMTFLEAYLRTGRVLNITTSIVSGVGAAQVPLLLNYQTHPHVLISSAVVCSGSMPNLLSPSELYEKCPETGAIRVYWHGKACYADGSIDFDIPSFALSQAFGVRYTIAVQVNPHVIPFNFPPHGEAGRPTTRIIWSAGRWRGGFLLCALELVLKETFRTTWKVMGLLDLLPAAFGAKWDLFFGQVYEGSVTLCTDRGYLWKVINALKNPSRDSFRYWWHEGQLMTWQKMCLLEKRLLVERELFKMDSLLENALEITPALSPSGASFSRRCSFRMSN